MALQLAKTASYFICLIFLVSFHLGKAQVFKAQVEKGSLRLDSTALNTTHAVELNGEWEFYWNKLLLPEDFQQKQQPDTFMVVPGIWNGFRLGEKKLNGTGTATYRLCIEAKNLPRKLSLESMEFYTSYTIWVNGTLVMRSGQTGLSKKETTPAVVPLVAHWQLPPGVNSLEIVIQLANFHHHKGGIWEPIVLGSTAKLTQERVYSQRMVIFLSGFIGVMSVYYLVLFILIPKSRSELYFTIFTGIMLLRLFVVGERIVYEVFPHMPFELIFKFEYFSGYLIIIPMAAFFRNLFENQFHPLVYKTIWAVGALFFAVILVFPASIFTKFVNVYLVFSLLSGVYVLCWVLPQAIKNRVQGGIPAFLGLFFFFVAGIFESLRTLGILHTPDFLGLGLACLVFFQAAALVVRFVGFYKENVRLSQELKAQNDKLEEKVAKRTKALKHQSAEILDKNHELETQAGLIFAREKALQEKNYALAKQSEMIGASIKYATTIQRAMFPLPEVFADYTDWQAIYLPKDVVSGDFYWAYRSNSVAGMQFIALVDCTGHGVPGGFVSMLGGRLLSECIQIRRIAEPARILHAMDQGIADSLRQNETQNNDGMDMSLIRLDKQEDNRWKICFAGAKQCIVHWSQHNNQVVRLKGTRKSIGGRASAVNYVEHEFFLQKGDKLYLYSDGIVDQANEAGKRFGTKRLLQLIAEQASKPLCEQKQRLLSELKKHQGNRPQRDDITLLLVEL